jgi:hypothetical protein
MRMMVHVVYLPTYSATGEGEVGMRLSDCWKQIRARPHQGFVAIGCMISGAAVSVIGPAVSFSTTQILGRAVPLIHVIGLMLAVGGWAMFTGVCRQSLPLERTGCLLQGSGLAVYATLLLLAQQWWAGPIIAGLAVAGYVKSRVIREQLTARRIVSMSEGRSSD